MGEVYFPSFSLQGYFILIIVDKNLMNLRGRSQHIKCHVSSTFYTHNAHLQNALSFLVHFFLYTWSSKEVCSLRASFYNFQILRSPWHAELQRKQTEIKMTKANSKVENPALQIPALSPRSPLTYYLSEVPPVYPSTTRSALQWPHFSCRFRRREPEMTQEIW